MLKVLSLFSGIGAFERAFCRIGLDWELVNYCEIDRWASLSYSMVNQCSDSDLKYSQLIYKGTHSALSYNKIIHTYTPPNPHRKLPTKAPRDRLFSHTL